jgi:hypothetical protein
VPRQEKLATLQTSGRQRINSHRAFDLETGQPFAIAYHDRSAQMIEALAIDAAATIQLLESIGRSIRCWRSSMFFRLMRAIIMRDTCRIGWLNRAAGSRCS